MLHMPVSYKFIFEACDDYKHVLGSVTGKQTLHIPWGKLVKEPSKWLMKRCYPKHFQWRDPSKIRIDETFQLIQHWRDRISRGRESLIWVKTSPLFKDLQGGSRLTRNFRQGSSVEQESSEENFELPSSSDEEGVTGEAQEVPSSGSDADADTADESGEGQDKGASPASDSGGDSGDDVSDGGDTVGDHGERSGSEEMQSEGSATTSHHGDDLQRDPIHQGELLLYCTICSHPRLFTSIRK